MQINNTVSILSDLKSKQDIFIFRTIYVVVVDVDGSVVRRCCSEQKLEKSKTSDRKNWKKKRKKERRVMALGSISAEDLSTIGGIATVSLLHSFIPTHWLPFSIVGRAQKWTLSRTLLVSTFPSLSLSILFFLPQIKKLASYAFLCYMHFINCMLVRDLVWTWQVEALQRNLQSSPFFSLL